MQDEGEVLGGCAPEKEGEESLHHGIQSRPGGSSQALNKHRLPPVRGGKACFPHLKNWSPRKVGINIGGKTPAYVLFLNGPAICLMKKWRLREAEALAQGHTATKRRE